MKKALIVFIVFVLLIAGFIYFSRTASYVVKETKDEEIKISEVTGEVREFEIIARQFEFSPGLIEVNKGDLVKLRIKSIDIEHGILIPEFGISKKLKPGEDVHIEFVADKSGEFDFSCNVYCGSGHRKMKGKLKVN